jgi:serine/threonine protein kinase/CheY-like chemotaxis protein
MPASFVEHGTRIGKYEILTRLSVGGMAELFLAAATGPGGFRKFVVLKSILPELQDDRDFVGMLLDEARITAALSHSNIAQVYDLGHEEGELFLVMEFIAGADISSMAKAARRCGMEIPLGLSCRVIRDACLALDYAHSFVDPSGAALPVIHRDISPRNIMATYAGGVKVIDFGIAKARGVLERTQQGLLKGSSGYMSPEQVSSDPLDGRSDLFSAGVVLHELLTGERLFRVAGNERATIDMILNAEVPPPIELNARVPEELSQVVLHALERDRDARFPTGKEMARAIDTAAASMVFSDDKVAALMRDLFFERIEHTRKLLALAVGTADSKGMAEAARPLGQMRRTSSSFRSPVSREQTTQVRPPDSSSMPGVSGAEISWSAPMTPHSGPVDPDVVLAVDDSAVGRRLVEGHLTSSGFHVVTCASGDEALQVLAEMRPNLVLLDVMMPGMDGFELCKRIREGHDRMTPIVFLSAACSLSERMHGLEVGGDDFVRKPYDPGELVSRIRGHLRRVASLKAEPGEPAGPSEGGPAGPTEGGPAGPTTGGEEGA